MGSMVSSNSTAALWCNRSVYEVLTQQKCNATGRAG